MKLKKILRERVLSLFGILLVAIGMDGLLSAQSFVYNSPLLGGVSPFVSPETVSQLANVVSWPFYVPLLIGCILVSLDLYYYFTKNKVRFA